MKRQVGIVVAAAGCILVVLGIAVRSVEVLRGNYVFGFDQGLDYMAARSIAVDHKLTLIGSEAGAGFAGLPGIFHGPGYHYLLALLVILFRGDPYGGIVMAWIVGIGVLAGIYVWSARVFGKQTALLVLILASLSPPLTAQSRMIWAPNYSGLLVIPWLFALLALIRRPTQAALFAASFFAAALYHFELPMAVPAVVSVFITSWIVTKQKGVAPFFIMVAGGALGILPMLLFELRHGLGAVSGFLSGSVQASGMSSGFRPFPELIGDVGAILTTMREAFLFPLPVLTRWMMPLIILADILFVYSEKRRIVRHVISVLLLVLLSHLVVFYPYRGPVYPHYLTLLYFLYPVMVAYMLERIVTLPRGVWIAGSVLLFIVGTSVWRYPRMITFDYHDRGGVAKILGKREALDTIYRDAGATLFGLLVFTPPVIPYAYDYLIRWYGDKAYGYVPPMEKRDVFYLLIEPDPEKPWSYNGWLETVVKDGSVTDTTTLPSGFIIEKRTRQEHL